MSGARWFIPYLAVSVVHVVSLVVGVNDTANATKFLLMPALIFAVIGRVRLKVRAAEAALLIALACAWIGDIFVSGTGNSGFMIGLAAFLFTHVVYFVLFIGSVRSRRVPGATALLLVWWIGILVLLREDLGVFLLPLAVYGLVLGASTAAAFATSATITTGAVLFLASDTSLAWALFAPTADWWNSDAAIMILYLAGQLLIVAGFLAARKRSDGCRGCRGQRSRY